MSEHKYQEHLSSCLVYYESKAVELLRTFFFFLNCGCNTDNSFIYQNKISIVTFSLEILNFLQ